MKERHRTQGLACYRAAMERATRIAAKHDVPEGVILSIFCLGATAGQIPNMSSEQMATYKKVLEEDAQT
jgi:hypothetical protein